MMKDLVVIGGGHAGCEAALAGARMGLDTLLLTLNMDGIALMACNPVIGGSAKGHLVRELDAMGGEMGRAIDDTFLQSRMLNMSKGPAVHALRAQADKQQYQNRMRTALMTQDNLTVRQGEVAAIDVENGHVTGVTTTTGQHISCKVAVVACGVYLRSQIIIGESITPGGPQGLMSAPTNENRNITAMIMVPAMASRLRTNRLNTSMEGESTLIRCSSSKEEEEL